jgi:hypothetical protein
MPMFVFEPVVTWECESSDSSELDVEVDVEEPGPS